MCIFNYKVFGVIFAYISVQKFHKQFLECNLYYCSFFSFHSFVIHTYIDGVYICIPIPIPLFITELSNGILLSTHRTSK